MYACSRTMDSIEIINIISITNPLYKLHYITNTTHINILISKKRIIRSIIEFKEIVVRKQHADETKNINFYCNL